MSRLQAASVQLARSPAHWPESEGNREGVRCGHPLELLPQPGDRVNQLGGVD